MSGLLINISIKQAYIFAGFFVFYEFLTYISNDMIMPGMLTITRSFGAPDTLVATSLVAYLAGGGSLQLFLGPLSDVIGRRPVMIAGAILFFIFTLGIGLSQSMPVFLLGRFFQGMGLCFLIIGYATIQESFKEREAVRLVALLANAAIIAPLLGPLLGAFFILHWNWRLLYLITALCSLAALYGLWRFMPETIPSTHTPRRLQVRDIINNYVLLLTHRSFMIGSIALGLLSTPCLAWIGLAPLILISKAKLSLLQYALWQIPFFSTYIVGNFLLRWLTLTHPLRTIIQIGSLIALLGLLLMGCLPFFYSTSYLALMPGLVLYGLGFGTTAGPLTRHVLFVTPISNGTTNALMTVIDFLIMGLGTEIANHLYQTQDNLYFGWYCAGIGVLYFILILAIRLRREN